jgi:small subunit ribosomal protein S15
MAVTKEKKAKLINDFAKSSQDTGSVGVQIALLTENISALTGHCKKHPQDCSTRRGLLKMVCRRRCYLDYLFKKDQESYKSIVERLGLKR